MDIYMHDVLVDLDVEMILGRKELLFQLTE